MLIEIPISKKVREKVKCISKPKKNSPLTIGKIYMVNEISILNNQKFRLKNDNERSVWYDKKYFKIY